MAAADSGEAGEVGDFQTATASMRGEENAGFGPAAGTKGNGDWRCYGCLEVDAPSVICVPASCARCRKMASCKADFCASESWIELARDPAFASTHGRLAPCLHWRCDSIGLSYSAVQTFRPVQTRRQLSCSACLRVKPSLLSTS